MKNKNKALFVFWLLLLLFFFFFSCFRQILIQYLKKEAKKKKEQNNQRPIDPLFNPPSLMSPYNNLTPSDTHLCCLSN